MAGRFFSSKAAKHDCCFDTQIPDVGPSSVRIGYTQPSDAKTAWSMIITDEETEVLGIEMPQEHSAKRQRQLSSDLENISVQARPSRVEATRRLGGCSYLW